MPEIVLTVLGEEYPLTCAEHEVRRIEDLAKELETRLANFPADVPAMRRLVLTALSQLDQIQATGAAVARAHGEIERLQDIIADAHLETDPPEDPPDGRVASLTREGTA